MKRKIIGIFICMLLFVTAFAVAEEKIDEKESNGVILRHASMPKIISHDPWDIQFNFDTGAITGLTGGFAGAEFDGTYFYIAQWGYQDENEIFKIDKEGNLVDSFIPTWLPSAGIRDLAWDGQYLYGSNAGTTIYCFDGDGTLIDTIETIVAVRSIAYDSENDAFWVNNWSEDLNLIDRDGNIIDYISAPPSLYGSAYDDVSPGGPYLWIFTGTSSGGPCQIEQYDLNTKELTGVMHSVSDDFGATGIAGGLFFTTEYEEGLASLVQQLPQGR